MQRFENMLPRTNGMRTANAYWLPREEAPHEIRKKPVGRPVASADHITRTGSRNTNPMFGQPVDRKIRLPKSSDDDFGAGLRAGVGIVAAQRISLTIGPYPLFILITFVRRDRNYGMDRRCSPNGIEDSRGADDVCLIRSDRILVGVAYQRLSSQMEDHFGPEFAHRAVEARRIPDVTAYIVDDIADAGIRKQVRLCPRIESVAPDVRAEMRQP